MSWKDRAIPVSGGSSAPKTGSWKDRSIPVGKWVEQLGTTVQEQHPEISTKDRLIAKNFALDPQKQVEYLKQQYPNLNIEMSAEGQIRAQSPGEKDWRVLDPDTGLLSSDLVKDVGDIGYDLLSGGVEGLAAVKGGMAAGIPTGGLGAVPGAMVASGAAGAGMEAMRQGLGSYLNIPDNMSAEDIAVTGGVSAVSPLLFGTGKVMAPVTAKSQVAKKLGEALNRMNESGGVVGSTLEGAGKAAGKTFDYLNPAYFIGEKVSGVPREILRNYADDGTRQTVKTLEKDGISDYSENVYDKLKNYVEGRKDIAGEELVGAIDEIGRPVNIAPAKGQFTGKIETLATDDLATNADQETVNALDNAYRRYFGRANAHEFLPDQVPAKRAWQTQKDLHKMSGWGQDMTHADHHAKGAARGAYFDINNALDEASEGLTSKAKDQYKAALKEEAELLPRFQGKTRADSIQKTYNEMSRLDRQGRKVMAEKLSKLSDEGALDLSDEAKTLATYRWLGNPNIMPVSSGGTTSTSRSIPLSVAGASLGALAGYNMGGGYAGATVGGGVGMSAGAVLGGPAAMKAYIRMARRAAKLPGMVVPKDTGLYRGVKNAIPIEMLSPEIADYVNRRED